MRRDLYLIGLMALIAFAIGVLLYVFGPASGQADFASLFSSGNSTVPFSTLEQGALAYSITERSNYRITSQDDLDTLWNLVYGDGRGPAVPHIDFTRYEVLAVFDGTHASDGYRIMINSIQDQDPTRTITLTHWIPGKHCRLADTPTSPFEIVRVPKTTLTITHQDVTATTTCAY